jgi:hypothetical protein
VVRTALDAAERRVQASGYLLGARERSRAGRRHAAPEGGTWRAKAARPGSLVGPGSQPPPASKTQRSKPQ